MILRDLNLSPYSKEVAVRNLTCKLKVLEDTRFEFRAYANAAKVKKDKLALDVGSSSSSKPEKKKIDCAKLGQVQISPDPLERVNAPWLDTLIHVLSLYILRFLVRDVSLLMLVIYTVVVPQLNYIHFLRKRMMH